MDHGHEIEDTAKARDQFKPSTVERTELWIMKLRATHLDTQRSDGVKSATALYCLVVVRAEAGSVTARWRRSGADLFRGLHEV